MAIPLSQIQPTLSKILDSLQGTKKMRSCLFNLIIYTHAGARKDYIRKIAENVINRFPSRVILMTLDKESTEEKLEASASVIAGAKGEFDIVCDFIELFATQKTAEKLPFVILPHLLADLPVYFVYATDPEEKSPVAKEIEKFATRIIFDSESANNLSSFAQMLLSRKTDSGCDIADLNWARVQSWRELISNTFYSTENLAKLQNAKEIEITYNSALSAACTHTFTQSIYLQGWIAAQLNWKLKSASKDCFIYEHLEVLLTPKSHPTLPAGSILSVKLKTHAEETFALERTEENPYSVKIEMSDLEKCALPSQYIFSKNQAGLSLVNEIGHTGTSAHYMNLLKFLQKANFQSLC